MALRPLAVSCTSVRGTFPLVLLAYTGLVQHALRKHYLGIAVAFLVFANLHSFGVPAHTARVMLNLLIGSGLIVAGVGDHFVLRKILHPPTRQAYVNTPV